MKKLVTLTEMSKLTGRSLPGLLRMIDRQAIPERDVLVGRKKYWSATVARKVKKHCAALDAGKGQK